MLHSHVVTILAIAGVIGAELTGCKDDAATPRPRNGSWPNEPSQFVLISDYGFEDPIGVTPDELPLGSSGWFVERNPVGNGTQVTDSDAPLSPPSVYQVLYPTGFLSGLTPATLQYHLSPPTPAIYWGLWWRASNPFQSDASGVNKIVFLWTQTVAGNSTDLLYFDLSPNPWRIRAMNDLIAGEGPTAGERLEPNVDTTVVTLGAWHRIEIYATYSRGGAANGVLKWWVDGTLNGNYQDLKMVPDSGFRYLQIAPTYGGNTGDVKLHDDDYWFDHTHVSRALVP